MRSLLILLISMSCLVQADELVIYIDADFANYYESSRAIELGILSAVKYHDAKLDGHTIKVERLDHHGNNRRSLRNLKTVLANNNTLAVFCGMHSPPVLANRDFINVNKLLLMDPWAAAAPITRPQDEDNYIFRLSVDDKTAGAFLMKSAVEKYGVKRPYLLLENTGWGKNNLFTLSQAMQKHNISSAGVGWFNWGVSDLAMKNLMNEIDRVSADSIILVGNANESAQLLNAMALAGVDLPVISHWGLTGGDFYNKLSLAARDIKLQFIQTSCTLKDHMDLPMLKQAKRYYPTDFSGDYLKSPLGFIHAYDLTSILINATRSHFHRRGIGLRQAVKNELENMSVKTLGLLKTYEKPFRKYTISDVFSHEALSAKDYRLGEFNTAGQIILSANNE